MSGKSRISKTARLNFMIAEFAAVLLLKCSILKIASDASAALAWPAWLASSSILACSAVVVVIIIIVLRLHLTSFAPAFLPDSRRSIAPSSI